MIEEYTEGRIRIDGTDYHQDVKIIDRDVIANWWRDKGHLIEEQDINDIFDADPDILVVGTGYAENVQISKNVISRAKRQDIRLIRAATAEAVKTFNRLLSEGKAVAGAFHLTC